MSGHVFPSLSYGFNSRCPLHKKLPENMALLRFLAYNPAMPSGKNRERLGVFGSMTPRKSPDIAPEPKIHAIMTDQALSVFSYQNASKTKGESGNCGEE